MITYMKNDINVNKKGQQLFKHFFPKKYAEISELILMVHIHNVLREFDDEKNLFNSIEIETINKCNNDCSFCPVNREKDIRPFAKMSDEIFYKIIDELHDMDYAKGINLFSNNEPLLDVRIYEFARYAREKLPSAKINIYTNGILLNEDNFNRIVPFVDYIQVDNYSDDMKISQHLAFLVKRMEMDKEINEKVNIMVMKKNQQRSTRGGEAPNKHVDKTLKVGCLLPFQQMVIRADGKVSLCCNDAYGQMTLGDISKNTIREIWTSEKYRSIRNSVRKGRKGIMLCKACDSLDRGRD